MLPWVYNTRPSSPARVKRFLTALWPRRAILALCCQNLWDVPRPGAAHVPANPQPNKPLARRQEAPSQPPPPASAFFFPHTIQDLPSSVPLNHSPGKSAQSLHPATGQHVWGQIRRLRGRLGWVRAGPGTPGVPASAVSHSKYPGCFPRPSPLSTSGHSSCAGTAEEWAWAGR